MRVTWLIHMLATIHSHVQHYPFICAISRIVRRIRKREYVNCDSTHPYVRHDSFTCATWLIHMCNMTHSHVQHDSFTCATWLIHMCNMTHSHVRHDTLHDALYDASLLVFSDLNYSQIRSLIQTTTSCTKKSTCDMTCNIWMCYDAHW